MKVKQLDLFIKNDIKVTDDIVMAVNTLMFETLKRIEDFVKSILNENSAHIFNKDINESIKMLNELRFDRDLINEKIADWIIAGNKYDEDYSEEIEHLEVLDATLNYVANRYGIIGRGAQFIADVKFASDWWNFALMSHVNRESNFDTNGNEIKHFIDLWDEYKA